MLSVLQKCHNEVLRCPVVKYTEESLIDIKERCIRGCQSEFCKVTNEEVLRQSDVVSVICRFLCLLGNIKDVLGVKVSILSFLGLKDLDYVWVPL